jgi:hypothetical protein
MYAAPGSECIQGLRWSFMQIDSVVVSKAPTKGKIGIVGYGFRYFADSQNYEADSFTLVVVGRGLHSPGCAHSMIFFATREFRAQSRHAIS